MIFLSFIVVNCASGVDRQCRLAFAFKPGVEARQVAVLSAQRLDISRVACVVQKLNCTGDL